LLNAFPVFYIIMEFSNTTTKNGIIQDCEFWLFASNYGQISNDANLLATFTSLTNRALDSVVTKIFESDDRWQFDDTNYTDYPIATTGIVANQRDYTLAVDHIKIIRVEVKDSSGNWTKLRTFDLVDTTQARDEFMNGTGIPLYYDKVAGSLFLYPQANYTQADSLRVYYQREPNYFSSTDTTKKAGFPNILHRIIPLKACYDFAIANTLTDKVAILQTEILKRELELEKFFGRRDKDEILTLREKNRGGFFGEPTY